MCNRDLKAVRILCTEKPIHEALAVSSTTKICRRGCYLPAGGGVLSGAGGGVLSSAAGVSDPAGEKPGVSDPAGEEAGVSDPAGEEARTGARRL